MKIAVVSDIHDNLHNLVLALDLIENNIDVVKVVFLWDFASGWSANILWSCSKPVYGIRGNNDGDKAMISQFVNAKNSNLTMWLTVYDFLEIDNRKIFITHFPDLVKPMAKTWDFDAIFYGHNHTKNIEQLNDCLILNPWEIWASKIGESTFAIYDTDSNTAELIFLEWAITTTTDIVKARMKKINYEFNKTKHHWM